uniref:Uncharacterized protein n=1 Tax=Trichogramma kaykai TaxID=54128 RepID=A0ABD2VYR2_9HYME
MTLGTLNRCPCGIESFVGCGWRGSMCIAFIYACVACLCLSFSLFLCVPSVIIVAELGPLAPAAARREYIEKERVA